MRKKKEKNRQCKVEKYFLPDSEFKVTPGVLFSVAAETALTQIYLSAGKMHSQEFPLKC